METLAMEAVDATDDALLARFASGDAAAFDALVHRYRGLVFAICRRVCGDAHEAEDATQAVFLLLARKARRLTGRRALAGWLHHASRNIARHRRDARRARRTVELPAQTPAADDEAQERWSAIAPILDDELAALPETYRAALVLHHLVGLSEDDAAKALGWKLGTLSGRLSRARELLRARLVRRGITVSLAMLAGLLGQRASAEIAPPAATLAGGTAVAAARAALRSALLKVAAIASACAIAGGAAAVVAQRASGRARFAFDFEDGRRPASLAIGDVVAGPSRAGSRFCAAAVADAGLDAGQHRCRVVFRAPGDALAVYRPGQRLSFACWSSGFVQLYLGDADRVDRVAHRPRTTFSTNTSLGDLPTGAWTRVDVDLAGLSSADRATRGPAAGDRFDELEIDAIADHPVELFIDDLAIADPGPPRAP